MSDDAAADRMESSGQAADSDFSDQQAGSADAHSSCGKKAMAAEGDPDPPPAVRGNADDDPPPAVRSGADDEKPPSMGIGADDDAPSSIGASAGVSPPPPGK